MKAAQSIVVIFLLVNSTIQGLSQDPDCSKVGRKCLDTLLATLTRPIDKCIQISPTEGLDSTVVSLMKKPFIYLDSKEMGILVNFLRAPSYFNQIESGAPLELMCCFDDRGQIPTLPLVLCAIGVTDGYVVLRFSMEEPPLESVDIIYNNPNFLKWLQSKQLRD